MNPSSSNHLGFPDNASEVDNEESAVERRPSFARESMPSDGIVESGNFSAFGDSTSSEVFQPAPDQPVGFLPMPSVGAPNTLEVGSELKSQSPRHSRMLSQSAHLSESRVSMSRSGDKIKETSRRGAKRIFNEAAAAADESTQSTAASSSASVGNNLLHNSCKLYPRTVEIIQSALMYDAEAIRLPVPVSASDDALTTDALVKKRKVSDTYLYPINIAISRKGSADVVELLAKTGPDVLLKKDGPYQSCPLSIALRSECDLAVIQALLKANMKQTEIADNRNALPLHDAVQGSTSLELVKLIYNAFPGAIRQTNVRGETPVQVAERNYRCGEDIVDFLQHFAYAPHEDDALHLGDEELDTIDQV